jgi:hypothetical protein
MLILARFDTFFVSFWRDLVCPGTPCFLSARLAANAGPQFPSLYFIEPK